MIEDNEAFFRRWVDEVWIKGNEEIIDQYLSESAVADFAYNLTDEPILGREKFKKFVRFIRRVYSDIQVNVEQIATDGNKIIAYITFEANQIFISEEILSVPKPVKVSGLSQIIIQDGKITNLWNNLDLFGTQEDQ